MLTRRKDKIGKYLLESKDEIEFGGKSGDGIHSYHLFFKREANDGSIQITITDKTNISISKGAGVIYHKGVDIPKHKHTKKLFDHLIDSLNKWRL